MYFMTFKKATLLIRNQKINLNYSSLITRLAFVQSCLGRKKKETKTNPVNDGNEIRNVNRTAV